MVRFSHDSYSKAVDAVEALAAHPAAPPELTNHAGALRSMWAEWSELHAAAVDIYRKASEIRPLLEDAGGQV
jgi:hypothetical protein